ncbi:MAG TPA: thermonuclease family protein, partial [Acidimicrobiales bacterium]|nr:thermonuclease family protein [Acidimicrobiales bacterium]
GQAPPAAVSPATATLPAGVDVEVIRVVDGDTLLVTGGERVRLIGVDTPETVDEDRPVGCFGKEASTFTASVVPPGTAVRLVGDAEQRDRFGRLLAYVYRQADGLFVNAELLRRGFAQLLTIPPNIAHTDEFAALARQARESAQGLWSACTLLADGRVAPASSGSRAGAG